MRGPAPKHPANKLLPSQDEFNDPISDGKGKNSCAIVPVNDFFFLFHYGLQPSRQRAKGDLYAYNFFPNLMNLSYMLPFLSGESNRTYFFHLKRKLTQIAV